MSFTDIKKAIKKDKLKDVKKLVKADLAIVNIENSDGETPLFVAVHEEHPEIVTYLIENGADVNHKSTKDGWTVLHVACYLKNMELFNLLLDNYVDIEVTSNTGATPLYLVCKHGSHNDISIDIIKALLLADIGDDEEDKYMLDGIFYLGETRVSKVITHRKNMQCINVDLDIKETLAQVKKIKHARIPMWKDNPDNIVGVLNTRELLNMLISEHDISKINIKDLISEPMLLFCLLGRFL